MQARRRTGTGPQGVWRLGRETVRKLFMNEPGVIKVRLGEKHKNTTLSIPASVGIRDRLLHGA